LVAPRTVYYRERNRIHYDGGFMNYLGLVSLRNLGVELGQADQGIQEVDASMAVTLLIDREKIGADDLYDEGYFFYFEDIDWSYRLRLEGHALLVHGGALVFHKEGTDELSFRKDRSYPSKRAYWFTRNRWRLALKCLRLRSLLLGAPAALAYEAAFVAFLTARGHLWSYLKGSASVLSTLGEILRLRKAVQSRRTLADRQLLGGRRLTFVSAGGSGLLAGLGERLLNAWILLWWRIIRPLI
ncbi:MAG: glycosyltransferase family 2 protein, partial [Planctomycetota bacterium]